MKYVRSRHGLHLEQKKDDGGAPGWTATSWLSSLPLLDILGRELLVVSGLDTRTSEEADCIKALSTEAIDAAVDELLRGSKASCGRLLPCCVRPRMLTHAC
jgi:hypothetical protein